MIEIDGAQGEGGGQVLRTALALSLATGQAFRIVNVRASRERPGLLRQHLTAVRAAQAVSGARVSGDALGSGTVTFVPGRVRPDTYAFAVGTAGSTTLVLQAILPALLFAPGPSEVAVEGGTHNPAAPPFEFLARSLAPRLEHLGARLSPVLERHGFLPAGGGRVRVGVEPAGTPAPLELLERGRVRTILATGVVSQLPDRIARTECEVVAEQLGLEPAALTVESVPDPAGPGNALVVTVETDSGLEVFTGFGRRGLPAEEVAKTVVAEVREFLDAEVPVGRHLADQLLAPLALAAGGAFRTLEPSAHARTVAAVIGAFLPADVRFTHEAGPAWRVEVSRRDRPAKEAP